MPSRVQASPCPASRSCSCSAERPGGERGRVDPVDRLVVLAGHRQLGRRLPDGERLVVPPGGAAGGPARRRTRTGPARRRRAARRTRPASGSPSRRSRSASAGRPERLDRQPGQERRRPPRRAPPGRRGRPARRRTCRRRCRPGSPPAHDLGDVLDEPLGRRLLAAVVTAGPRAATAQAPGRTTSTPATSSSTAATTGSNARASRPGSCSTTVSCGQRPCASRLRSPRRTPSARARSEQASTRLACSTATGPVAGTPSTISAAITGQSGHHSSRVRAGVPVTPDRPGRAAAAGSAHCRRHRSAGSTRVELVGRGSQTLISLGRAAAPRPRAETVTSRRRSRPRPCPSPSHDSTDHLQRHVARRPTGRTGRARCRAAGPGRPAGWRPRRSDRGRHGGDHDVHPVDQRGDHGGPLGAGVRHQGQPVQGDAQPRPPRPPRASAARPRRTRSRPGTPRRAAPAAARCRRCAGAGRRRPRWCCPGAGPVGQQPVSSGSTGSTRWPPTGSGALAGRTRSASAAEPTTMRPAIGPTPPSLLWIRSGPARRDRRPPGSPRGAVVARRAQAARPSRAGWWATPSATSTTATNCSAARSRSSASRALTTRGMPASAAARLAGAGGEEPGPLVELRSDGDRAGPRRW